MTRKRYAILILLFVLSFVSWAKADTTYVNAALTKQPPPPDRVAIDKLAKQEIQRLYFEQNFDSALSLVHLLGYDYRGDYLQKQTELLLLIKKGALTNDWCDTLFNEELDLPRPYRHHVTVIFKEWSKPDSVLDSAYNAFLADLTQQLLSQTDTNSLAHLVCRYYAGQRSYVYKRLSRNEFSGTCLQESYTVVMQSLRQDAHALRFHWSLSSGMWIPLGSNKSLGNKMEIGIQAGGLTGSFGVNATLKVKFLDAKQPYTMRSNGIEYTTKNFCGWFIGIDPTLQLFSIGRYAMDGFCGIGYDWFSGSSWGGDGDSAVNTFTVNVGLIQKIFANRYKESYLGVQVRYNFVQYDTNSGTDLSGNTLSLHLVWGHLDRNYASRMLESFSYHED